MFREGSLRPAFAPRGCVSKREAELETELAATFFNHLANTFEAQMFNVTSKDGC